jgi:signal transduction histidine kinase
MLHVVKQLTRHGTGHDSTLWPVLLLVLIVLVPSAGVVWMMRAAMENEQLAARQKLSAAYRGQLETVGRSIAEDWQRQLAAFDAVAERETPARAFADCLRDGAMDSVVILDEAGEVLYPSAAQSKIAAASESGELRRAQQLEFAELLPGEAAEAYAAIAEHAKTAAEAAQARQAQARALAKAGDRAGAVEVLEQMRDDNASTDLHGRLLSADAELRLLELLERESPEWRAVAEGLARRVNDYSSPVLTADQRRFVMHELESRASKLNFSTLAAEDLAAEFVAGTTPVVQRDVFAATKVPELLQVRSPSGRVIALVLRPRLKREVERQLAEQPFPAGVATAVREAGQEAADGEELAAVSLAPLVPGLRMVAMVDDASSFDAAADKRLGYLLATGVVVVGVTAALAMMVAGVLRRQWRLTRLKNDLVATVSHELKTPLAAIRLLVDTLLDEDSPHAAARDPRTREYLEMIAKENSRLTRLIDNFLTFSRMERGKHRFDFRPADGAAIVEQAAAAVADRFDGEMNTLAVDVAGPLPVVGDADMLVTVVTNLLDNAWKYTDEPKQVTLAARRVGDRVEISVSDNGIGLSTWAARRVFDRFYQVDQRLTRSAGGCGLGLSIVKYIVEAHGGTVAVESRHGGGSTFAVSLPADTVAVMTSDVRSMRAEAVEAQP